MARRWEGDRQTATEMLSYQPESTGLWTARSSGRRRELTSESVPAGFVGRTLQLVIPVVRGWIAKAVGDSTSAIAISSCRGQNEPLSCRILFLGFVLRHSGERRAPYRRGLILLPLRTSDWSSPAAGMCSAGTLLTGSARICLNINAVHAVCIS